jgi:hypothetical protein
MRKPVKLTPGIVVSALSKEVYIIGAYGKTLNYVPHTGLYKLRTYRGFEAPVVELFVESDKAIKAYNEVVTDVD